jgi:AcrR family transcriptional regulator
VTARAEPEHDDAPRRGRPRSESSRKAILAAAGVLLVARGLGSISMDEVAERAGASKATIYRWWPSKELLALDALFSQWESAQHETTDTGSLEGDLVALIRPWARQLAARPFGRVMAAFINRAQNDHEFAEEYRARFLQPRREQARVILTRAIDRGEVPPDTDLETAVDFLYGPLYHRVLHGHAELSDRFIRTTVGYVIAAVGRHE